MVILIKYVPKLLIFSGKSDNKNTILSPFKKKPSDRLTSSNSTPSFSNNNNNSLQQFSQMDSRLLAAISSQSNTSSIGAVATTTTAVNGTNGGSTITGANTNVTASLVSPVKQPPAVPPHNTATKVISYLHLFIRYL